MFELFQSSPSLFFLVLLVFGVSPGFVVRLVARAYPKGDDRRTEMIAELYAVPTWRRPMWVAQQFEVATSEGISARVKQRRMIRQQKAAVAVERRQEAARRRDLRQMEEVRQDAEELAAALAQPITSRPRHAAPREVRRAPLVPAVLLAVFAAAFGGLAVLSSPGSETPTKSVAPAPSLVDAAQVQYGVAVAVAVLLLFGATAGVIAATVAGSKAAAGRRRGARRGRHRARSSAPIRLRPAVRGVLR